MSHAPQPRARLMEWPISQVTNLTHLFLFCGACIIPQGPGSRQGPLLQPNATQLTKCYCGAAPKLSRPLRLGLCSHWHLGQPATNSHSQLTTSNPLQPASVAANPISPIKQQLVYRLQIQCCMPTLIIHDSSSFNVSGKNLVITNTDHEAEHRAASHQSINSKAVICSYQISIYNMKHLGQFFILK